MSDARVLAELLGWSHLYDINDNDGTLLVTYGRPSNERPMRFIELPDYDTDLNAMAEVWKVLKEKGLWDEFIFACFPEGWILTNESLYEFTSNFPRQIKAAIKVLKEVHG